MILICLPSHVFSLLWSYLIISDYIILLTQGIFYFVVCQIFNHYSWSLFKILLFKVVSVCSKTFSNSCHSTLTCQLFYTMYCLTKDRFNLSTILRCSTQINPLNTLDLFRTCCKCFRIVLINCFLCPYEFYLVWSCNSFKCIALAKKRMHDFLSFLFLGQYMIKVPFCQLVSSQVWGLWKACMRSFVHKLIFDYSLCYLP